MAERDRICITNGETGIFLLSVEFNPIFIFLKLTKAHLRPIFKARFYRFGNPTKKTTAVKLYNMTKCCVILLPFLNCQTTAIF